MENPKREDSKEFKLKRSQLFNSAVFIIHMCFPFQLRYKETFQKTKGKYHTVKDALDIVYHRRVTDDISKVCP